MKDYQSLFMSRYFVEALLRDSENVRTLDTYFELSCHLQVKPSASNEKLTLPY